MENLSYNMGIALPSSSFFCAEITYCVLVIDIIWLTLFIPTAFHAHGSGYNFRNPGKSFCQYISFLLTSIFQVSAMPIALGNVDKNIDSMDPVLITFHII